MRLVVRIVVLLAALAALAAAGGTPLWQPLALGLAMLLNTDKSRALVQIEQLHLPVPAAGSISASNRTALQWQLP